MTIAPEILYSLGAFALLGGRLCGGIQWQHWHALKRRHDRAEKDTQPGHLETAT